MKKIVVPIILVILIFVGLYVIYLVDESPSAISGNFTSLNVSSEGPLELRDIIRDVKTAKYYEGYDNDTVKWMESLGDKKVFTSSDYFVVMDSGDAMKIPSQYVTDAYIVEFIDCNVVEKHSLGDVKYPRDVLLVNNVEYQGEEIHYFDV
ncbi:MAG: hypothetical protein IJL02_00445 [Methanobrevibacter sp.]|uniref:hypothetical protein n=1 Tax=Methanobrevibacter sp. TaxID=66852 RepID=UPI0025DB1F21|nr:hypothetical protein [Methanobrevibacter sp.]MBQ6098315.1 hypothetical protein [Methanobrevibacter sp.]